MPITPLQFEVHPSSGVPLYRQIMDQVQALVAGGKLVPGDLLPSVRDMAGALQINMMTVSKAYSRLEAAGVLGRVRGQGMVVEAPRASGKVADRLRDLKPAAEQFVVRGLQLDLTDEQILGAARTTLRDLRKG